MSENTKQYVQGTYSTGEIARLCGVTVRTVQYYDKRGILSPKMLTEGGRRMYTDADVRKLRLLSYLRSIGLSIDNISKICREENADKVTEALLAEQIQLLSEEIDDKKKQLSRAKSFLTEVRSLKHATPELMQDIADIMEKNEKMKTIRRNMWIFAVVMGLIEYGNLIYAIASGNWWMFGVGMAIVLVLSAVLFLYYTNHVSFLCPECHRVFRGKKLQILFAAHTYRTRKLTCPHCGKKSFCIETARTDDDE